MNIFDHYRQRYEAAKDEEFTLQVVLTTVGKIAALMPTRQRLLMAIGEPVMVDTAQDPDFLDSFSNRVIARYPALKSFTAWKTRLNRLSLI